jgi:hypothetical protein
MLGALVTKVPSSPGKSANRPCGYNEPLLWLGRRVNQELSKTD